ncbi:MULTISPECIES: hypothetical protein [Thermocrispum]|uniref:FKBP-type peptidyl-prolyl cis-trans isomerase n=1 Tax=Thermocrispum agreste TaxID=37925 RepID=A0A2W4J6U9_9PSEU|nr:MULTISPECIES: hypothetical protein [Thermocrispum]PZM94882.1 MAG: peptidylprolyl isomerase [Thermocrispum agreste]
MRNARAAAVVAAAGAMVALAACSPSLEEPSPLPPGTEPDLTIDAPSSAAPADEQGSEPCAIEDFTVAAEPDRKPEITVPSEPCAAPESPLTKVLEEGEGPAAEQGDTVSYDYVVVGVTSGTEATNWSADGPELARLEVAGDDDTGWSELLEGMRPGARKLVVLKADQLDSTETGGFRADEAVAVVVGRSE